MDLILKHIQNFDLILFKDTNICLTGPCQNGGACQVTGTGSTYTCICPQAYSGATCQICKLIFRFNYINNLK